MEITIPTPPGFSFRRTVLSHGWCALRPFEFDKTEWTLVRVVDAGETAPVTVKISGNKKGLAISTSRRLKKKAGTCGSFIVSPQLNRTLPGSRARARGGYCARPQCLKTW